MYLLYADESGTVDDPNQRHFVLAGASVFERATHWIEKDLDNIAARFAPHDPRSIELHASPMRGGRGDWRRIPLKDRLQALQDALTLGVAGQGRQACTLFAVVVDKQMLSGEDPVEYAFKRLSEMFDSYLRRIYLKKNDAQRGLIIFDKASVEPRIQQLAREFKRGRAGTKNYADVPMFLDSRASRLIQLADLVAFAIYRKYEANDEQFFRLVEPFFDSDGGAVVGFHEHTSQAVVVQTITTSTSVQEVLLTPGAGELPRG